ncbi:AAA family ATPase [Escherichia coli]|uniref:AAA family ATPase n=1 Tax=Escherichia coli TaxID=562 RepID=UPI0035629E52
MRTKIKKIKIDNLFGIKNIEWHLEDVSVLVGKNGTGKSTILNIMKSLLLQEADKGVHQCDFSEITMSDGTKISHKQIPLNSAEFQGFFKTISQIVKEQSSKNKIKNIAKDKLEDELKKITEIIEKINTPSPGRVIRTGFFQVNQKVAPDTEDNEHGKLLIPFEYISTINMNANSLNEVKSSDGNKTTILDMEIKKEISRMNEFSLTHKELCEDIKKKFTLAINNLFLECGKKINFGNDMYFTSDIDGKKLNIKDLSSGERQLVYTLLKAAIAAFNSAILLMDEPEISLHLSWQEKLISTIKSINPDGQIIIVTHSPAVVMAGWMNSYIDIKDLEKRS